MCTCGIVSLFIVTHFISPRRLALHNLSPRLTCHTLKWQRRNPIRLEYIYQFFFLFSLSNTSKQSEPYTMSFTLTDTFPFFMTFATHSIENYVRIIENILSVIDNSFCNMENFVVKFRVLINFCDWGALGKTEFHHLFVLKKREDPFSSLQWQ